MLLSGDGRGILDAKGMRCPEGRDAMADGA